MKYTAAELRELLKSRDTALRMKLIRMCDVLEEPDRTQLLCIAIKDRSSYLAADAAVRLVARAEPCAAEPVLARFRYLMEDGFKRDPGCYIRANLAAVLGNMHSLEAVPALRDGLRAYQPENCLDTAGPLRSNCAMALASIPFGDPVMDLTFLLFYLGPTANAQLFFDRSSQVTAVQALIRLGQAQAGIVLYAKLSDPAEANNALLA
jgi:HEAT repeat protein